MLSYFVQPLRYLVVSFCNLLAWAYYAHNGLIVIMVGLHHSPQAEPFNTYIVRFLCALVPLLLHISMYSVILQHKDLSSCATLRQCLGFAPVPYS